MRASSCIDEVWLKQARRLGTSIKDGGFNNGKCKRQVKPYQGVDKDVVT